MTTNNKINITWDISNLSSSAKKKKKNLCKQVALFVVYKPLNQIIVPHLYASDGCLQWPRFSW